MEDGVQQISGGLVVGEWLEWLTMLKALSP